MADIMPAFVFSEMDYKKIIEYMQAFNK